MSGGAHGGCVLTDADQIHRIVDELSSRMMIKLEPEEKERITKTIQGFMRLLEKLEEAPAEGRPLYHVLEISGHTRIDLPSPYHVARENIRKLIEDKLNTEGFLVAPWKRSYHGDGE